MAGSPSVGGSGGGGGPPDWLDLPLANPGKLNDEPACSHGHTQHTKPYRSGLGLGLDLIGCASLPWQNLCQRTGLALGLESLLCVLCQLLYQRSLP